VIKQNKSTGNLELEWLVLVEVVDGLCLASMFVFALFGFIFILELYLENNFTCPFEDDLPPHLSKKRNHTGTNRQHIIS